MVEAAARYGKAVQVGTMNRSGGAQNAVKFMQDGGIGKIYMARAWRFKPRLQHSSILIGRWRPANNTRRAREPPASKPAYDAAYLSKVDDDMWVGSVPKRPLNGIASITTRTGTGRTATAISATRS